MTLEAIQRVIAEKAEMHPELRAPLGLNGLRRILQRENIMFIATDLPRPAQLLQWRGQWAILVDQTAPPSEHLRSCAHELGHLWLHHDPCAGRWEPIYNRDYWESDDVRETDAENFAILVMRDL